MEHYQIEILGETWEVRIQEETDERRLAECSGFTDWTERVIVVYDGRKIGNLGNPERFMIKVLRHEIIHAFLYECGLGDDWEHVDRGHDETMVDWIAHQLPKMSAVCKSAECRMMAILEEKHDRD